MHKSHNSFDSTPKTDLSSIPEPNPVVRRKKDQFMDIDDSDQELVSRQLALCSRSDSRSQSIPEEKEFIPPSAIEMLERSPGANSRTLDADVPVVVLDTSALPVNPETKAASSFGKGQENKSNSESGKPKASAHSPTHSRKYSDIDAASIIQRNWVNQNYKKRKNSEKRENDNNKDDGGSVKSLKSHMRNNSEALTLNLPDDQLLYANLTRASYMFESPLDKFLQSSSDVQITSSNQDLDLKEPWIPPSIDFAKNAASLMHPRQNTPDHPMYRLMKTSTGRHCVYKGCGEQCDLFHEGSFSSFGQFGAGITNYFKFVKWCFWIFVSLAILYLPALIFAVNGDGGLRNLARVTLGNVAPYNNTDYTHFPDCQRNSLWNCHAQMDDIGLVWESIDILACIVVLAGYLWLRFFEKAEVAHLNRTQVSPADYTVLVSNLPPTCTEADLRVYFAKLMNEAVCDIVFIYDDEDDIATFRRRGALVKKRYHITQQYRYHHGVVSSKDTNSAPLMALQKTIPEDEGTRDFLDGKLSRKGLLIHLAQERARLTASIKLLDRRNKKTNMKSSEKPLNQAYVTFHQHSAKTMAIKMHKVTLMRKLKPNPGLFLKGSRLHVSEAQDPEKIVWENIKYSPAERYGRQFITFVVGLLVAGICVVMISISLGYDIIVADEGGTDVCPAHFYFWSESQKLRYVDTNPESLHCYCDENSEIGANPEGCGKYFDALVVARLFRVTTGFCCSVAAIFIDVLLALAQESFEKHTSTDGQEKSIMWRSVILKTIIYGLLFLFTMGHINQSVEYEIPKLSFNFTPLWYNSTGQALVLTMLFNIFLPHVYQLYIYIKFRLKQRAIEANRYMIFTQDEMNTRYTGPEFVLSHRYSQLIATFAVLYMYITSFPIFGIIGIVTFYLTYWIDKFMFIKFYVTPIRYPTSVGLQATALIPYAVVAHLILALWAVSKSEVFENSQSENNYGSQLYHFLNLQNVDPGGLENLISQSHTVYLALLLIFLILVMFLKLFVHHFLFAGSRISQLLCFEFISRYDFFFSTKLFNKKKLVMSYPRAVRRGYIKGLDNYNILENQRYKDAFNIDETVATQHRRVRSLLAAADGERVIRTGAPKPLPDLEDPITANAMSMFQLYAQGKDSPRDGRGTPRDGPPKRNSKQNGGAGNTTPRDKLGGITPRERVKPRHSKPDISEAHGINTPRSGHGDGTPRDGQGHRRPPKHASSYDQVAMDYGGGADIPFHVVRGNSESRLVSDSYNIRIKEDMPMKVKRSPADSSMNHVRNSDISDLSSSGGEDEIEGKPVAYATLSMRALQERAESEEVIQARVLKRFESESEYEPAAKKSYKTKSKMRHEQDIAAASPLAGKANPDTGDTTMSAVGNQSAPIREHLLMRAASEELISAARPTIPQKRPANVPKIAGIASFPINSFDKPTPSPSTAHDATQWSGTPRAAHIEDPVASSDVNDEVKRSAQEWIAPTPRAVVGTPRDDGIPGTLSRDATFSDMPPPSSARRGSRVKSKNKHDADVPTLRAVSATGEVIPAFDHPENHTDSSSKLNAQRVLGMGGQGVPDIRKSRVSISARRKSQGGHEMPSGLEKEPVLEGNGHKREKSDVLDPSKKFVPKSHGSFGNMSSASLHDRKHTLGEGEGDADSLGSLSPVNVPNSYDLGLDLPYGDVAASKLAVSESSDVDDPKTPRIRTVRGPGLMSQSAPNSTEPKKPGSFERYNKDSDNNVNYKRGSEFNV